MYSLVLRNRIFCLSRVAFIILAGNLAVGCSSDVTRFDRQLYAALPKSKPTAYEQAVAANTQYPDGVDRITTASISSASPNGLPLPIARVETPNVVSDDGGYIPGEVRQLDEYNSPQPINHATRNDTPTVVKSALPKPGVAQHSVNSVAAPTQAASSAAGGWSSVGGTAIVLRDGETLYNVSKRYGVPVTEIMRANNIKSAANLSVGQQIIVPTYVYSQTAAVSAPDLDPRTRAARASTGVVGQQNSPRQEQASLSAEARRQGSVTHRQGEINPPDYSVVTGSVSGKSSPGEDVYLVRSGDVLGKIAIANNVSVSALQQANNLSGTTIRVGQKLVIPPVGAEQVALAKTVPAGVDPITTGTPVATERWPKPYVKPTVDKTITTSSVEGDAPKSTGIERLRWPVSGRVISQFGAKKGEVQNDGIDISVPEGTSVKAAENGVVIYSGDGLAGFGNLILIRHDDGIVTAYGHNKSVSVAKGNEVRRGQVIALSGKTGDADAPMLHFEVRKNAKPVDPLTYLGS